MANIKSQKKRIEIGERNHAINSSFKTEMRHAIKKVKVAAEAGDIKPAEALLPDAVSLIDKPVPKGIQHPHTAARQTANLYASVNAAKAKAAPATAAEAK